MPLAFDQQADGEQNPPIDRQAEIPARLDPVDRLKALQIDAVAHHVQSLAIGAEFGE